MASASCIARRFDGGKMDLQPKPSDRVDVGPTASDDTMNAASHSFSLVDDLKAEISLAKPDQAKVLALVESLPRVEIFDDGVSGYKATGERAGERMKELFMMDARVFEGQTIEEHTLRVMDQYMKYFSEAPVPAPLTLGEVLIKLTLHDSGKAIPADKAHQHESTVAVTDWLHAHGHLPVSDQSYQIMRELIHGDPIGAFARACAEKFPPFQVKKDLHLEKKAGIEPTFDVVEEKIVKASQYKELPAGDKALETAAAEIEHKAEALGMRAQDVLALYLRFYQADTTAYTTDSRNRQGERGSPSLEGLYVINQAARNDASADLFIYSPEKARLEFTAGLEQSVQALEKRCRELDQAKGR